jgi:sugar lactone lactonase YvrE
VVGPGNSVIATDSTEARINEYDAVTGALRHSWRADGVFKRPTGITIDPSGRIAVADRETHVISIWNLARILQ